jgi:hypothetical protein
MLPGLAPGLKHRLGADTKSDPNGMDIQPFPSRHIYRTTLDMILTNACISDRIVQTSSP